MKRLKRNITCRDDALARVKRMAARAPSVSEWRITRAAQVVHSMEEDGPPPNTAEYELRDGRMLYVYQIAGVRFEFYDDGETIEILDIEFRSRR